MNRNEVIDRDLLASEYSMRESISCVLVGTLREHGPVDDVAWRALTAWIFPRVLL